MHASSLLDRPALLGAAIELDRAPALLWLGLLTASLASTWWWMGQRMVDGSDDPLGLLALAALGWLVWRSRAQLRPSPRLGWLAAALAATVVSTATLGILPALLSALLGLLALGAGVAAFLPRATAGAPVLGLSVLSLPLLASMQFYAGYPLRVLTAEASRWLLAPFFAVERMGTALHVDGRLVIVDAPCSGVQMLWFGYFTACVVALHAGRCDASFLARLPAVSLLVMTGNIARNAVLVACEARGAPLPGWAHEGIGLVALAAVCAGIAWAMHRDGSRHV